MKKKTALVFGGNGLIGTFLVQELIRDNRYAEVVLFLRKSIRSRHLKLREEIVDFKDFNNISKVTAGDEVYCCVGTTIRKAGSQERFRKVDFDLPVKIAELCAANHIEKIAVVSSLGADPESNNFYLRTKGEMEKAVLSSGVKKAYFFRPSMLLGKRSESRPAEFISKYLMQALSFLFVGPLKKYKAIHAKKVARAMVQVMNNERESSFVESYEMH